jgi:hypothetical protein
MADKVFALMTERRKKAQRSGAGAVCKIGRILLYLLMR